MRMDVFMVLAWTPLFIRPGDLSGWDLDRWLGSKPIRSLPRSLPSILRPSFSGDLISPCSRSLGCNCSPPRPDLPPHPWCDCSILGAAAPPQRAGILGFGFRASLRLKDRCDSHRGTHPHHQAPSRRAFARRNGHGRRVSRDEKEARTAETSRRGGTVRRTRQEMDPRGSTTDETTNHGPRRTNEETCHQRRHWDGRTCNHQCRPRRKRNTRAKRMPSRRNLAEMAATARTRQPREEGTKQSTDVRSGLQIRLPSDKNVPGKERRRARSMGMETVPTLRRMRPEAEGKGTPSHLGRDGTQQIHPGKHARQIVPPADARSYATPAHDPHPTADPREDRGRDDTVQPNVRAPRGMHAGAPIAAYNLDATHHCALHIAHPLCHPRPPVLRKDGPTQHERHQTTD